MQSPRGYSRKGPENRQKSIAVIAVIIVVAPRTLHPALRTLHPAPCTPHKINCGDYCCSELLYQPKVTFPAMFDNRNYLPVRQ